jgi:hypothetical protein
MSTPEPQSGGMKTAQGERSDSLCTDDPLPPSPEVGEISRSKTIDTSTDAERVRAATADLEELQRIVGDRVRAAGQFEAELDRILLEDD